MNFILTSPSLEDLIRLLRAWRFWVLGALAGALLGAAVYLLVPPTYRARATVNVDFNLEQAWPKDTDRQQFYYLERESRKLEEIGWSDSVITPIASKFSISAQTLRAGKFQLSQPAEAGWHFYADDADPKRAAALASAWADAFTARVQQEVTAGDVNQYVRLEVTQSADLPIRRRVSLSAYALAGALLMLTLAVFALLFFVPRTSATAQTGK